MPRSCNATVSRREVSLCPRVLPPILTTIVCEVNGILNYVVYEALMVT